MAAKGKRSIVFQDLVPLVVLAVLLAACAAEAVETTEAPSKDIDGISASDIRGGESGFLHLDVDQEAPGFTLTDQNGQTVRLADFHGKWVVIDWIYTNCMTVCPTFTAEMNIVRKGMAEASDNIQYLSITFDPERDTQEVIKAHAALVGADEPDWSWLRGTKAETDAVAEAYGLSYQPGMPMHDVAMFDHTALLVIVDPDGRIKHRYLGTEWAGDVVERLNAENAIPQAGAETAAPPPNPAELGTLSAEAYEILDEASALTWEEWELESGVISQTLYQFPNTGRRGAFVDQVRRDVKGLGITPFDTQLIAMKVDLIDWNGELFSGVGYLDTLVVLVDAGSAEAAMNALSVLDNEWCCGTTP